MALLNTKDPAEIVTVRFDFCALAPAGAAPLSAAVTIVLHAGEPDQDLSALLLGAPVIEGPHVLQRIGGGLVGSIYRLKCRAAWASGDTYALSGDVPVNTVFGV